jgi:hypothetical protein
MRTIENPAYPLGKLVGSEQPVWFDDLTLAVYPLGLYGVQPRALLRKKAAYDPHSSFASALFDTAVVLAEPAPHLPACVPACVVPDQEQNLPASLWELLATQGTLGRYGAHGPSVHESQPRITDLWQVESVAGDGFRLGVVFGDRPFRMRRIGLPSSEKLLKVGKATLLHQHSSHKPTAQVSGFAPATSISRSRRLFSIVEGIGGGDPAFGPHPSHSQKTRKRSPDGLARDPPLGKPLLEAACPAISRVQRLVSYPNSLGERWSISLRASALSSSKASRVLLGREDLATRASKPLWLNSWMASRTVCCPQPRLSAIFGAYSPLELASKIWHRRKVKASLERREPWRASRSSKENGRTEIEVFMVLTVTRNTKPILKMH